MTASLFISGALTCGYAVIALFFLKFWRDSRDSLFAWFGMAFVLLAIQRTLLGFIRPAEILYVVRLAAFVLIIVAIVNKNRKG